MIAIYGSGDAMEYDVICDATGWDETEYNECERTFWRKLVVNKQNIQNAKKKKKTEDKTKREEKYLYRSYPTESGRHD